MISSEKHYEGRGLLGMPDQSLQPTEPHVLADPINFPLEYKNWLVQYVQNELHIKQIPGYTAATTAVIPAITLPASPTDGQRSTLTDSLATPTYVWDFTWSTAAAAWLFIGGSPQYAETQPATSETTASTTYVDLTTVGPSLTVPRAGNYLITMTAHVNNGTAASTTWIAVKRGAAATVDADGVSLVQAVNAGQFAIQRTKLFTGLAASTAMKLQYRSAPGPTGGFIARQLSIIPVSVT